MESLEPRLVFYVASGYEWASPNVSFSFVPEGASVEGFSNVLFSKLNAIAPTAVWQREFARALQTWANVSNLNFHLVADSGAASGTSGSAQGDSRFGDIRLAMHALSGPLAYAYYPTGSSTITGDIFLSTEYGFRVGADFDLYSTLLHESGHSLGLRHTAGTVMNSSYQGVLAGLTADDVAGIQSIYGARQQDAFDAVATNNSLAAATAITVGADGKFNAAGDLQSLADVDYYAFAAPQSSNGSFTISIDAAGLSLLASKVSVYNAAGTLLGQADLGAAYGTTATVNLSGVAAGQVLYVMADGATGDAFGMGAYRINAAFGLTTGGGGGDPVPPPGPTADRYEINDTLAAAANLGKFSNNTVSGVSLHSASDVDFYSFSASRAATFQISTQLAAGSSSVITVYNSAGAVLQESTSGSVVVSLARNATSYVRVSSPTGAVSLYDLVFTKIGNLGSAKLQGPGKLLPDAFYANASDAVDYDHEADYHGGDRAEADIDGLQSLAAIADKGGAATGGERSATALRQVSDAAAGEQGPAAILRETAPASGQTATSTSAGSSPLRRLGKAPAGILSESSHEWAAAVDELLLSL